MRFGNDIGKLVYKVKYINTTGKRSFTYEYIYKIDDEKYFMHYVPGIADYFVEKLSRYSNYKNEEVLTVMNDLEVYAYKKNCEYRRRAFADIMQITDYEKDFNEEYINV